jgi:translation initiation factor IF-3
MHLKKSFEPFIVKNAKFLKLKLTDSSGGFHQEIPTSKAKEMAISAKLDLVCFKEPNGKDLAFCKIIDYGKWKFNRGKEKRNKKKESVKSTKSTKEIRLTPVIGDHDLKHKMKQACGFLDSGDDVLFLMRLKGRQMSHMGDAEQKMNEIISSCESGKEVSRKKTRNSIAVRVSKGK